MKHQPPHTIECQVVKKGGARYNHLLLDTGVFDYQADYASNLSATLTPVNILEWRWRGQTRETA